jgi:hypothetical protein
VEDSAQQIDSRVNKLIAMNPATSALPLPPVSRSRWQRKAISGLVALLVSLATGSFQAAAQPVALSSYSLVTNQIGVLYSVPVSDLDPGKYSINQPGALVTEVRQGTPTNLTLLVSGLTNTTYNLTYTGVLDENSQAGSGVIAGTNFGLVPVDVGTAAFLPSSFDSIGTPGTHDLTRVSCVGEQIEFNFNFLYTKMTGNFDLRVNLRGGVSAPSPNNSHYAFGGAVVRTGLDEAGLDPYLFMGVGLPNSEGFPLWLSSYRSVPNGGGVSLHFPTRDPNVFPNAWLRITRHENILNTYFSADGTSWTSSSGDVVNNWTNTLYVGIASCGYGGQSAPPASTFDYGNFSLVALPPTTNAVITITQQPTNATVFQGQPVSFSVVATVTNGSAALLKYQWRSNGVDLVSATNAIYSLANAYSNATYSVFLSSSQAPLSVTSSVATLIVIVDPTPAAPIISHGLVTNRIGISFDDIVSDTNPAKFTLNQPGATVDAVTLSTPTNLTLTVSGLTNPAYTLTLNGVLDAAGHSISGSVPGTNKYALTPIDIGSGAAFPSKYDSIGTPSIRDLTRVSCVGEQIEFNFNFLYTTITGNFDLRVNLRGGVSALSPNNERYAFGGVVVRTGLAQLDAYLFSGVGLPNSTGLPLWLSSYRAANNGGAGTLSAPGRDPSVFPNAWLRVTRSGQVFNAYLSTDGTTWVDANGGTIISNDWPDEVYVGLASCGYGGQSGPPASTFDYGNFSIEPLRPALVSAARDYFQPTKVTVVFSLVVNPLTATTAANYTLNAGNSVVGATLEPDGKTVTLTTTAPLSSAIANILTVSNVQDEFGSAILPNAQISIAVPNDPVRSQYAQGGSEWLVLEAEHYSFNASAAGRNWNFTTLPPSLVSTDANTNYSGVGAMFASPNAGINIGTPALGTVPAGSPRMDYKVQFTNTGTFYVWLRGVGDSGGASVNDSVFVGLDGGLTTRLTGFNAGQGYFWANTPVGDSGPITVTTTGNHILNVWMREDGFVADKILLVSDVGFVPSGVGPEESPALPAIAPTRLVTTHLGSGISIGWSGVGVLQASTNVAGPFVDVVGAGNPYTVTTTNAQQFYRVRQ